MPTSLLTSMLPSAARLLLVFVVIAGGYLDLRCRRIPNFVTVPALISGVALNTLLYFSAGAIHSAEGLGLALLAYVPLYLLRAMGAGDVKLMAAVGAIVGPTDWFLIFLVTSLVGGVLALGLVLAKKRFHQTMFNLQTLVASLMQFRAPWSTNSGLDVRDAESMRLPHGAVIACGAMLCTFLGYLG